jgi:hypothetical protein
MSQPLNDKRTLSKLSHAPYRLINGDSVGSFLLECDSGVSIYIHKEIIPVIVNGLRLMNLFLNKESIRYLVDYFSVECDSEVSTIYIHKDTISLIANGLLLIMKLFLNKGQLPYQLRTCLVDPSSDCHSPPILNYQQALICESLSSLLLMIRFPRIPLPFPRMPFPRISLSNTEQPSSRLIKRYPVGPSSDCHSPPIFDYQQTFTCKPPSSLLSRISFQEIPSLFPRMSFSFPRIPFLSQEIIPYLFPEMPFLSQEIIPYSFPEISFSQIPFSQIPFPNTEQSLYRLKR